MANDPEILCQNSPAATAVLEGGRITKVNDALLRLFELASDRSFIQNKWLDKFIPEEKFLKVEQFLAGTKTEIGIDIKTGAGNHRYVRIIRNPYAQSGDKEIIVFEDLTSIHENSLAFQAGYDEFINVTMELEEALKVIKQQKDVLEKQHAILENELRIAHNLQNQLYKEDFSKYKLFKVHGFYQSMESLGGDMWEIFESENEIFVVLGDVMGHGVASSLISITAKTLFKKKFEELSGKPDLEGVENIFRQINAELLPITKSKYYITAGLVRIRKDFKMNFGTAGHPPILLVPPNGQSIELITEYPMLGMFHDADFASGMVQVEPGSRILLYTDCLIENGEDLETALPLNQVAQLLSEMRDHPSLAAVLSALVELRRRHTGLTTLPDDLAMICIEVPHKAS